MFVGGCVCVGHMLNMCAYVRVSTSFFYVIVSYVFFSLKARVVKEMCITDQSKTDKSTSGELST